MHVGLNLIYLVPGETGGTRDVRPRARRRARGAPPHLRMTAFVNSESASDRDSPWPGLVPTVTVPVNARRRSEWVRGEQQLLPGLAARAGVDVIHSLANTSPLRGPQRRVVTIQDVIFKIYPGDAHARPRACIRVLVPLGARRAHRIIASSASTRDDLVSAVRRAPVEDRRHSAGARCTHASSPPPRPACALASASGREPSRSRSRPSGRTRTSCGCSRRSR